ncbi:diadenosine tetraphosphate hydrolase, partial [Candidatus Woesearchaeota archaeon]|nr:diadenosine tetraphosphate hydrolase [Candidatus Woesearchaeota archaeon]
EKLFDEIIIKTENFSLEQDWEIPIPGFFVVAAKRKIRSVAGFTDEEAQEFINLVTKARKGMREVLGIKDVYLFQRENTKYNFHLWLFPRYEWMKKFGEKIDSVQKIIIHAKENMVTDEVKQQVMESAAKMRKYMKDF